ncbi:MAG TPA: hypothetical protein VM686_30970 [Polyangiaceae bacterium]|nr:hypothetical protein [Polyangiaceae bacterium]
MVAWRTALGFGLFALGCADPLDVVGVQQRVSEQRFEDPLKDDNLADKHPEYDPERTVEESFDGCRVTLNKSASVTRLTITKLEGDDAWLAGRVFPTRAAALEALGDRPVLPSMEVVNGGLKPFNDGLYAAVELAAETGKAPLFRDLLAELVTRAASGAAGERTLANEAAADIGAALLLAGEDPDVSASQLDAAQSRADAFVDDGLFAKPIGFYTWTPELERIFTRDRWLQRQQPFGPVAATALALAESPSLGDRYAAMLSLYAGLTDPFYDASPLELARYVPDASALDDVSAIEDAFRNDHPVAFPEVPSCNSAAAYMPASESAENRMIRTLLCTRGLAPGENLLDALILSIQNGELDLTPREDSGWYDHQLYALETLLAPDKAAESDHLLLTREYKEKLVETFKSLIVQTRETHVKQVGVVGVATSAEAPVREYNVYPKLVVEPFPTFYLRTARAYQFVTGVISAALGQEFLDTTARLLEDGTRHDQPLGDELRDKTELLYGLHLLAADSLGAADQLTDEELPVDSREDARARARTWIAEFRSDMDVNRDPRVSLPVAVEDNGSGEQAVYWAVVGVKVLRMHASFPESHRPEIVGAVSEQQFERCVHRDWVDYEPYLLVEQTIEARRSAALPPLTRDEFRGLCDDHETAEAIRTAFESAP